MTDSPGTERSQPPTLPALRQAMTLRWGADQAAALDTLVQSAAAAIDRVLAIPVALTGEEPDPVIADPRLPDVDQPSGMVRHD